MNTKQESALQSESKGSESSEIDSEMQLGARNASWAAWPNLMTSLGQEESLAPLWGHKTVSLTLRENFNLYDISNSIKT